MSLCWSGMKFVILFGCRLCLECIGSAKLRTYMKLIFCLVFSLMGRADFVPKYSEAEIERIYGQLKNGQSLGMHDYAMWIQPRGGIEKYHQMLSQVAVPMVVEQLNTVYPFGQKTINATSAVKRMEFLNAERVRANRPQILYTLYHTQFVKNNIPRLLINIPMESEGVDIWYNIQMLGYKRAPNKDLFLHLDEIMGVAIVSYGPAGRLQLPKGTYFFDLNSFKPQTYDKSYGNCAACHNSGTRILRPNVFSIDLELSSGRSFDFLKEMNQRLLRAPLGGPFGPDFKPNSLIHTRELESRACMSCHNQKTGRILPVDNMLRSGLYEMVKRGYMPKASEGDWVDGELVVGPLISAELEKEFAAFLNQLMAYPWGLKVRDRLLYDYRQADFASGEPPTERLDYLAGIASTIPDSIVRDQLMLLIARMRQALPKPRPDLIQSIQFEFEAKRKEPLRR